MRNVPLQTMRELSGGKPVGFKLCLGKPADFMAMVKAMISTNIEPDFITIDGGEGGTGAAPMELSDSVGMPLTDGLIFVHNVLVGAGLRRKMRLIASGKIVQGFDIAKRIAQGADLCNSARGMMFALGCIQARRCHTNRCPTGIATQDPWRVNGLNVEDKAERVANYHAHTMEHFLKLLAACGVEHADSLTPDKVQRRLSVHEVRNYASLFTYLRPDSLLEGKAEEPYQSFWNLANAGSF